MQACCVAAWTQVITQALRCVRFGQSEDLPAAAGFQPMVVNYKGGLGGFDNYFVDAGARQLLPTEPPERPAGEEAG